MVSIISPETYSSIKTLSKEYKIINNSNSSKKNKQLIRIQLSEMQKNNQAPSSLSTKESIQT
jgi:hypothetical protein